MNLLSKNSFIHTASKITQTSLLAAGLVSLNFLLPPSIAQPETLANNTLYNIVGRKLEISSPKITPVSNGYSLGNRANTVDQSEPSPQTTSTDSFAYMSSFASIAKNLENTGKIYYTGDNIGSDKQSVDFQNSIQVNDVPEPSFIPGILFFTTLVFVGKIKLTKQK